MRNAARLSLIVGMITVMLIFPGLALAQQNLLTNGDFETGNATGWTVVNFNNAPPGVVTPETAASGSYSLKFTHYSNNDWNSIGQNINGIVQPDKLYKYRFAYKTTDPADSGWDTRLALGDPQLVMHSTAIIYLGPYSQESYFYGSPTYYVAPLIADGNWHYVECKVSRTASELSYEPMLCFYYDYNMIGTIYLDDFQVTEVELTPPTTTIDVTGTAGSNGWYTSDVTVTLAAYDNFNGSGVAKTEYSFDNANWTTYTAPFTITTEGTHSIYYRSVDNDGNIESTQGPVEVNIDKTQPQVAITTPADGAEYLLNQLVLADWTVFDPLSGIFSAVGTVPSGNPIDTTSVGTKPFSVYAEDYAGNNLSKPATYYVKYSYNGVLQPINQDGSSIFKMGSNRTVPVKFQLQDANGNYVSTATARLYVSKVSDNITGTELEAISTSAATEGNLFRYDSTSNQYIFNLATSNLSTGTWQLRIDLDDGTSEYANISLK